MTEADWDRCDDAREMLAFLRRNGLASGRRLRLFEAACDLPPSLPADFWWGERGAAESAGQAKLVRDIFGNPFRPAAALLPREDGLIPGLAQAAYDRLLPAGTLDPACLTVL